MFGSPARAVNLAACTRNDLLGELRLDAPIADTRKRFTLAGEPLEQLLYLKKTWMGFYSHYLLG